MILAVDVDYAEHSALAAGVQFSNWDDVEVENTFTSTIEKIYPYEPGSFYKRELPCILQLLDEHALKPEVILVDGYVFLDGDKTAGLGKHLFDALSYKPSVVGVAKRAFRDISTKYKVYRGDSRNPLFVTSIGLELDLALEGVSRMSGRYRIPELLKKVDRVCRGKSS